MNTIRPILAIVPARGGSKGLPGKNIRPLLGLPLLAHTLALARLCPEIDQVIVSTDSPEIAKVAADYGAPVPFLRPPELARDDTPMWPVLRHALSEFERIDSRKFGSVLLIDPTTPARLPGDIAGAVSQLEADPSADGVIGVSVPEFNPFWVCVVEREGYMRPLIPEGESYTRRQDLPTVYRINGTLYLWRREFFLANETAWRHGRHRLQVVPEIRATSIDDQRDLDKIELFIRAGIITLPWLPPPEGESADRR
jgi:N-acylneuraminate cytidylyltransferase